MSTLIEDGAVVLFRVTVLPIADGIETTIWI